MVFWASLICILTNVYPATALDPARSLNQLHHTSWNESSGISGRVFSLAQTKDGFLWVGTSVGLYRFDGMTFEPYRLPRSSLPVSEVRALLPTEEGGLWVGYRTGVAYLKGDTARIYTEQDGLPYGRVRSIACTKDGTVWAAVIGGFARLEGDHWRKVRLDWDYPDSSADTLFVDRQDTLWVATGSRIRYLPSNERKFRDYGMAVGLVPAIRQSADGTLWVSEGASEKVIAIYSPLEKTKGRDHPPIPLGAWDFLFDEQGQFWFATEHGVWRVKPEAAAKMRPGMSLEQHGEVFREQDGLSDALTSAVLEDREGNIWVGTANGLDRFRNRNTEQIDLGANYRCLLSGRNGDVWAASIPDKDHIIRVQDHKVLSDQIQRIYVAARDKDGAFWISWNANRHPSRNVLTRVNNGVLTDISFPGADRDAFITDIGTDSKGMQWAAVSGIGEAVLHEGTWKTVPVFSGKDADLTPDSQFIDDSDRVWLLYYARHCIAVVENGVIKIIDTNGNLNVGSPRAVAGTGSNIWIAGTSGLTMYDGQSFRRMRGNDGNPFADVLVLLPTKTHGLWLEAGDRVIYIPESELKRTTNDPERIVQYRQFDTLSDFGKQLFRESVRFTKNAVESTDGKLWFLTKGGVAVIDPSHLFQNDIAPPVVVRSLTAGGKLYSAQNGVHLPPSTRDFSIDYTALSLTLSERNQFRYRLRNFDTDWQEAKGRRQAFYTNVPPGRYEFQVLGSNNDGIWNTQGARLVVIIPPTFFQTVWFKLICLVAISSLIVLFFLWRISEAERRVKSHLSERLIERERIARELHDTLLQGFQGLILRFQTAASKIPAAEPSRSMMESALNRADEVMIEGRNRVRDLRTETIPARSLLDTLRSYADELNLDGKVELRMVVHGAPRTLHALVREEAGQIGKEALANAFRHSRASHIEVETVFEQSRMLLRVRDNGVGIDQQTREAGKPGHFGISGMSERAKRINAEFGLWSSEGAGTEVELIIPARIAYADASSDTLWLRARRLLRQKPKD